MTSQHEAREWQELARATERKGWRLLWVHGSHHVYGLGGARVTIPVHGNTTLKTGTRKAIMKQTGITESDL